MDVNFPNRTGAGPTEIVSCKNNIVIIGANGSGKSRLGAWLEKNIPAPQIVHRISAQKALVIPDFAPMKSLGQAENELLTGHQNGGNKMGHRWGGNPETFMLQDYNILLTTLFAKTNKRDSDHSLETRQRQVYVPVPDSPIDIIIKVWKDVMPQREIDLVDGKVLTRKTGQAQYNGKEMSDGERVCLYLMGQCLCAPENSIIIIDEPELHLHKSLMARLWNKIEEVCPNKYFIYVTHDLDFASSRKDAIKIWVKSYENSNKWVWDEVPDIDEIPENLVIEILGSRKDIIFCEGEKSSIDVTLYQTTYPNYHIIPRGGCEKVIESVKAMRGNAHLHHLNAFGLIDSDYRSPEELEALEAAGVYPVKVAEVENLFCVEPLLRIAAAHLGLNENDKVNEVTNFIISELRNEIDIQVASHAEKRIQFLLNNFSKEDYSEAGLQAGMVKVIGSIDIPAIYAESKALFQNIIDENSLEKALKHYNRKTLVSRISVNFGLRNGEYLKLLIRLLKSDKKPQIVAALKTFVPNLDAPPVAVAAPAVAETTA